MLALPRPAPPRPSQPPRLHGLGYREASHSGYICDERWYAVTYGVRRRGGARPEELAPLRQPTWCRLAPEHWQLLLERGSAAPSPETLLLVNRGAGNGTGGDGDVSLGAAVQQGHAARSWRQQQQQRRRQEGGGALASAEEVAGEEEAELEAGVAATLAALARVEQALLRPEGRQRQHQQQQGSAQSAVKAAVSTTTGGGGSRAALGAGGAAAAAAAASATQQAGAGLVRSAGLPLDEQQQQQQPLGLLEGGADSGHAQRATPAAMQQR